MPLLAAKTSCCSCDSCQDATKLLNFDASTGMFAKGSLCDAKEIWTVVLTFPLLIQNLKLKEKNPTRPPRTGQVRAAAKGGDKRTSEILRLESEPLNLSVHSTLQYVCP